MYINRFGELKVRVRGINQSVRWLAGMRDSTFEAARVGAVKAAEYLMAVIKEKFGSYQATGGDGGGPWKRLSYETNTRKLRKYGFAHKPLIASGDMKESFYVKPGGKGRLSASVASDDPKLIHHIYGAPRANVPQRDPMLISAIEEADMCEDIIRDEVYKVLGR